MATFTRTQLLLLAAALLLLAGLAYRQLPSYGYTDLDTPTLLLSNRIEGPGDLIEIFAQEIRREVHAGVRFYRPLTGLSYALNQAWFGLASGPMHLFDIAVHALNALLVAMLFRAIGLRKWSALLGAVLFVLHPLGVETVPAIARRADLLAVFFVLLSTWARVQGRNRLAWTAAILAPLAKETAFILPVVWAFSRTLDWRRVVRELRSGALAILPAFALRFVVLGGLGGYQRLSVVTDGLPRMALDLFDPHRVLSSWGTRLVVLLLFGISLWSWRRRSSVPISLSLAWLACSLSLATLGGEIAHWYLYSSIAPAMMLLVSAVDFAVDRSHRMSAISAVVAATLCLALLIPSPLWIRYPEWGEASRLLDQWDAELRSHVESGAMPEGQPVVLLGVPMLVGQGPTARFPTRTASVAIGYTLQHLLQLRHDIDLPIWCAVQAHLHQIGARYEILVEQHGEEILVRGEGPIDLDASDRLAVWRSGQTPPYTLRRGDGEFIFTGVVPPIWRWNGEQLQPWP